MTGTAPAADVALARAACDSMRARFRTLFGEDAPPGRIELSTIAGFTGNAPAGWWQVRWSTVATLRATLAAQGRRDVEAEYAVTLPHEIGHQALAAFAYPDGVAAPGYRYGTPLPDWLDEAVAIWMETAKHRDYRLSLARASVDSLPPLDSLLVWMHPSTVTEAERSDVVTSSSTERGPPVCRLSRPCDTALNTEIFGPRWRERERITVAVHADGRTTVDTVYLPADYRPPRDPSGVFYPSAIATLTWIHRRGGSAAVQELIRRARAEPASRGVMRGLPGLPDASDEVERQWRKWVRDSAHSGATPASPAPIS